MASTCAILDTMSKVIAVCGAGGKTTRLYQLKDQYLAEGQRVLLTTTTKMLRSHAVGPSLREITDQLHTRGWILAGSYITDRDGTAKIGPLPRQVFDQACQLADVVLVEADGSRHHSVKVPNATDIVLPPKVDEIEVIMGTWDIGRPAREVVHRSELLPSLGYDPIEPLSMEMIREIIRRCYLPYLQSAAPEAEVRVLWRDAPCTPWDLKSEYYRERL